MTPHIIPHNNTETEGYYSDNSFISRDDIPHGNPTGGDYPALKREEKVVS